MYGNCYAVWYNCLGLIVLAGFIYLLALIVLLAGYEYLPWLLRCLIGIIAFGIIGIIAFQLLGLEWVLSYCLLRPFGLVFIVMHKCYNSSYSAPHKAPGINDECGVNYVQSVSLYMECGVRCEAWFWVLNIIRRHRKIWPVVFNT
jgi:hypothetical protein